MSCNDDFGSPVVKKVNGGARLEGYYQQMFVISKEIECEKLKTHLLVDISNANILRWIQKVTDTQPILMVYGGYGNSGPSSETTFLNSVEILSGSKDLVCKNHIASIDFNDAKVVGSVGGFAKNAIIFCGGGNTKGISSRCYEYLPHRNKWDQVKDMTKKRIFSTSVREKEGNMWVLGGVLQENEPTDTEAYDYQKFTTRGRTRNKSEWKKDRPIPSELNFSGIVGHCTVQINKTHVFLTGGYSPEYQIPKVSVSYDPLCPYKPLKMCNCTTCESEPLSCTESRGENEDIMWPNGVTNVEFLHEFGLYVQGGQKANLAKVYHRVGSCKKMIDGGKKTQKKAWIFDGYKWKHMPAMPFDPRDRPACAMFEAKGGRKKILVAGGCKESCIKFAATTESVIFDLGAWETGDTENVWKKVADLPIPLSNARMELFEGLPTIIGGGKGRERSSNSLLYQYHGEQDKWEVHGRIKMEVARTSAAVVAVPKSMFSYCFADLKAYSDDAFQEEDYSISLTDEEVANANYKKFSL